MEIRFGATGLERCYRSESEAIRQWGPVIGRRYILRVNLVYAARTWADLLTIRSLRLHPLRGQRAGQWAMALQGRWRLVAELEGDSTVVVREVTEHYGD